MTIYFGKSCSRLPVRVCGGGGGRRKICDMCNTDQTLISLMASFCAVLFPARCLK